MRRVRLAHTNFDVRGPLAVCAPKTRLGVAGVSFLFLVDILNLNILEYLSLSFLWIYNDRLLFQGYA